MLSKKTNKNNISVADYSKALYQLALGAAAKAQEELQKPASLAEYKQNIADSTLGLLASGLWLTIHVGQKSIFRVEVRERCRQALIEEFLKHIEEVSSGQCNKEELKQYLKDLFAIYDDAWKNKQEPGNIWWLAEAMAREILNAQDVPEIATVIMLGEVESTLALGARLAQQYIVY
ncbi:MAG: hypothetical protein HY819_05755 [Acidobacteria bacterium]|nr:hypothetical protein [Acidobacteriota bacterium]